MAEIFLPTLHTFAMNNIFTGSCGLFRFRGLGLLRLLLELFFVHLFIIQGFVRPFLSPVDLGHVVLRLWYACHSPSCFGSAASLESTLVRSLPI